MERRPHERLNLQSDGRPTRRTHLMRDKHFLQFRDFTRDEFEYLFARTRRSLRTKDIVA